MLMLEGKINSVRTRGRPRRNWIDETNVKNYSKLKGDTEDLEGLSTSIFLDTYYQIVHEVHKRVIKLLTSAKSRPNEKRHQTISYKNHLEHNSGYGYNARI